MHFEALRAAVVGALFSAVAGAFAQTTSVTSEPVGFTATSCLANSDTYLSIPFTRPPEFTGSVQSISGNALTINGSPGWTPNQYVYAAGSQPKHYYMLIGSGGATNPKEGHIFPITANNSSTLTVDTTFDNLNGVVTNTQISIIPYWTPATIFPASDANVSFTPTTSSSSYQTEIRVPSASTPGINLPYSATYYFSNNVDGTSNNVGWREVGDTNTTDHSNDPLLPDSYFVVRNSNGAPTLPLTALGSVLMKKVAVPLLTSATTQQDNAVAMIRPVDVPLNETGLAPFDNSFTTSDQLLLFDNSQAQFDKQPSKIYTYNNGWRLSGDATGNHSTDLVPAGSAMLVRKAAVKGGATVYWVNSPTYVSGLAITPLQAVSRKTHGSNAIFDVNLPVTGSGIECRKPTSGGTHEVVFTFANNVTVTSATVTPGANGTASISGQPSVTANQVTVNLANVSNAQRLTLNLVGVTDGTNSGNVSVPMGVLLGDTTGDGTVNSADVSQTKARSGQAVNTTNFRNDVNLDGNLNSADVSLVKSKSGTALP
ncbi:MAG: TIGR02597 family protein [Verrucomicrobia bacterium]|nr:TIGR02597 family protein [Verrucomicrobiota bacterium]